MSGNWITFAVALAALSCCSATNYNQDWSWQGVGLPSTFQVVEGDTVTLELTSIHNVLLFPSKDAYDACDFTAATMLLPKQANGSYIFPALGQGSFYLGCSLGPHCTEGRMKMIIDVSAKPVQSAMYQNYKQIWAFKAAGLPAALDVVLGDTVTLVLDKAHNIFLFRSKFDFDACDFNEATLLLDTQTNGSYTFPANGVGQYYFGCALPNHCSAGAMKMSINVKAMMSSALQVKRTNVIQAWTFGAVGLPSYNKLYVGDTVTFELTGTHNIMQFATEAAYNNCDFTDAIMLLPTQTNGSYVFPAFGEGAYYLGCSLGPHCAKGNMKTTLVVGMVGTGKF